MERYVRRHFALLAALFLAPLNRYLTTLNFFNTDRSALDLPNFSEEDFLASLSKYGCSVRFRGGTKYSRDRSTATFYRKFIRSPNFYTWLQMKTRLQAVGPTGLITPSAFEKDEIQSITAAGS